MIDVAVCLCFGVGIDVVEYLFLDVVVDLAWELQLSVCHFVLESCS